MSLMMAELTIKWKFICLFNFIFFNWPLQTLTAEDFSKKDIEIFSHLAVDRNSGNIFVGATNKIYQLTEDLEIIDTVITGPAVEYEDSPLRVPKKVINNINKILIINYSKNELIFCGSILQGICSIANLNNISEYRYVERAVANSEESASTVAFIAPGPPDIANTQVLYVGNTLTENDLQHPGMPAISSRSLEEIKTFEPVTIDTQMFVRPQYIKNYPIYYVHGFSTKDFSYFITQQLDEKQLKHYYSKIVRLCQNDKFYNSYTEIPLKCSDDNFDYSLIQTAYIGKPGLTLANRMEISIQDDVLFAAFRQNNHRTEDSSLQTSALCIYSLKSINRKFMENIKSCLNGKGKQGLDFLIRSSDQPCIPRKISNLDEDFCGSNVNTPLGGELPAETSPVLLLSSQITAITAVAIDNDTVVFLGTSRGHLKKIVIESASYGYEYADIVIHENSPINKDMHFDSKSMNLFAMTDRKISKVKLHNCSVHSSCFTCLKANDPFCSWCRLENKCDTTLNCPNSSINQYWKSLEINNCNTEVKLKYTSDKIMQLDAKLSTKLSNFWCVFTSTDKTFIVPSKLKKSGVHCVTPKIKSHKRYTRQADSENFNECGMYYLCTDCTGKCRWSVDECIYNVGNITSEACNEPKSEYTLIASGTRQAIGLTLANLNNVITRDGLKCHFTVENNDYSGLVTLNTGTYYCETDQVNYLSEKPFVRVPVDLRVGAEILNNLITKHYLIIYKCNKMANSCISCLNLPASYECGWCQSTESCEVQRFCKNCKIWLSRQESCSNNLPFNLILSTKENQISIKGIIYGSVDNSDPS